jgi:hypothetical protein
MKDLIKSMLNSDPRLAFLVNKVDQYYVDARKDRPKRPSLFRTSSIINEKFCMRQSYWDLIESADEEAVATRTLRIWANGDDVHNRTQNAFDYVKLTKYREKSFYSKLLELTGTPDIIIDFFGCAAGVEIKSMHKDEFYHITAPPKGAFTQAQMYMYITGTPYFIIWVECKNDQNIKTFLIEFNIDFILPYIKRVRSLYKHYKAKKVPKSCFCETKKDRKKCKYNKRCFA